MHGFNRNRAFHRNKAASIKDAKAPPIRQTLMAIPLEDSGKLGGQNSREKRRENGLLLKQFEGVAMCRLIESRRRCGETGQMDSDAD